jgi:hypothetical protein
VAGVDGGICRVEPGTVVMTLKGASVGSVCRRQLSASGQCDVGNHLRRKLSKRAHVRLLKQQASQSARAWRQEVARHSLQRVQGSSQK